MNEAQLGAWKKKAQNFVVEISKKKKKNKLKRPKEKRKILKKPPNR